MVKGDSSAKDTKEQCHQESSVLPCWEDSCVHMYVCVCMPVCVHWWLCACVWLCVRSSVCTRVAACAGWGTGWMSACALPRSGLS